MSDRSLTLLEIHLGDGDIDIGPLGVLGGTDQAIDDEEPAEVDVDAEPAESDGSTAQRVGGLLLALTALVVVAVAVVKLLGDEETVDVDLVNDADTTDE